MLEENIESALAEVAKETKKGIDEIGEAFERGDALAVVALLQTTVQLQAAFLEQLQAMVCGSSELNYTHLEYEVDLARNNALGALLDLRQRLSQKVPMDALAKESGPSIDNTDRMTRQSLVSESQEQAGAPSSGPHRRTWTREFNEASESQQEDAQQFRKHLHLHRKRNRHGSLLSVFGHHRSRSTSTDGRQSTSDAARRASMAESRSSIQEDPGSVEIPDPERPSMPNDTDAKDWSVDPKYFLEVNDQASSGESWSQGLSDFQAPGEIACTDHECEMQRLTLQKTMTASRFVTI